MAIERTHTPIPFKCKEPSFKHGHVTFTQGNTYTEHDLIPAEIEAYVKAGFIVVDGMDEHERNPTNVIVIPDDVYQSHDAPKPV